MSRVRAVAIWLALALIAAIPVVFAMASPLLAWREPIYIAAGIAGVLALVLLLLQPLLAAELLPGLGRRKSRRIHRWTGIALVALVIAHVAGLWITSPPDVIDALTFTSPTPFAVWGVIAMWAVFATATLAILRRRLRYRLWQAAHVGLGLVIVVGTVLHVVLIEGTMEWFSKLALSAAVLAATAWVVWSALSRTRAARRPGTAPQSPSR